MHLLEVKDLTIQFGGLIAVNKINLVLDAGETLGVIGPNGSGKTTLFNLLSGIYAPTAGTVCIDGVPVQGNSADKVFKMGIARTFQNGRLFWNLNVLENVMMGLAAARRISILGAIFGLNGEKIRRKAAMEQAYEVMGVFGTMLTGQAHKLAKDLPYADRRRLEICRAIASQPKILLLDEPSAGMDTVETENLMLDLIKVRQANPAMAMIVVEHDMDFISGLVDRAMVLNYGSCIAEGCFDEVVQSKEVVKAYLGEEDTAC